MASRDQLEVSDETERLRVKIVVRPSPSDDSKLSVEDAMQQVLDAIAVLNAARASACGGVSPFIWKLEKASTNTPFTVEAVAHPTFKDVPIAEMVAQTKSIVSDTLLQTLEGNLPSCWINRDGTGALTRIAARSMNGIASTLFDLYDSHPIEIDRNVAPRLIAAVRASDPFVELETPRRVAYGDIDGRLIAVGTHYRSPAVFLLNPMYGRVVCTIPKERMEALGGVATLEDVWRGKAVIVTGRLYYAAGGRLTSVMADDIRERQVTPVFLDEVIDADFTAGLEPPEYLDKLHEGELG